MDKLTGHGHPSKHLVGKVGQHYEDLDTGDIYECRIANKHSHMHGWPVGGYIWELRAKGEDIQEFYGKGGEGSGLPTGGAPYQQLVTDGEGVARWEDRTHYAETALVEEVPETEITMEVNTGFARASMNGSIYPTATEEGEIRTIVFDGEEYECAMFITEGNSFGNASLFPGSSFPDTGEPFLYVYTPGEIAIVITHDTEPTTHTIACYNNEEIIKPLDPKYLPDNVGGSGGNIFPVVINMSFDDAGGKVVTCDKTAMDIYEAVSQKKMPVLYVYEDGRVVNYSTIYMEYYDNYQNEAGEWIEDVGVQFITFANYPQGGFPISYAILFDGTVKNNANMGIHRLRITSNDGFFMQSSTPESKKMFRIEVDDSGAITATEVT